MTDSGRLFYGLLPIGSDAPAGAGGNFEAISTITVGAGGASSIEFTDIPQGYSHLQIRMIARAATAAVGPNVGVLVQANNDTGSNYAWHELRGNGSAATAAGEFSQTLMEIAPISAAGHTTTGMFGAGIIDLLDYGSTSKTKAFRSFAGLDTDGAYDGYYPPVVVASGLWNSTSAVTSIKFTTTGSRDFAQYSQAALYGIGGAA